MSKNISSWEERSGAGARGAWRVAQRGAGAHHEDTKRAKTHEGDDEEKEEQNDEENERGDGLEKKTPGGPC